MLMAARNQSVDAENPFQSKKIKSLHTEIIIDWSSSALTIAYAMI